ncbi:ribonuclease Z [Brumimicrobium aurantiacum]|uniref:Ribonuclease Z n=1 Tax=Brumimicrobium aurantiacum TaxID=1737063 RepID=A0A3E1EWP2_9FLAO|nr:ribonuclease Z [Brumimicrobium aurantiacum]RFC53967.1 ribonuclease Z [Brumimicrobium aurantiacum]
MSFNVTILGSGAAVPTLKRGTTSQLVTCNQRTILIDCGEGTQIQMRKFKVKFQNIQVILISHLHGDHVFGLPGLISTMQLLGRQDPLKIIGPKGIKEFLLNQFKLSGLYNGFPLEFTELETNAKQIVFEDKCLEIHTFPLKHRIQTQGYRINEKPGKRRLDVEAFEASGASRSYIQKLIAGDDIMDNEGRIVKSEDVTFPPKPIKSYAFCSDTAYLPELIDSLKDVDLLYHEATFLDKESERAVETFHSTAKQAATIALKSNAKRLILGHFSARYKSMENHQLEAESIFERVYIPTDGEIFHV